MPEPENDANAQEVGQHWSIAPAQDLPADSAVSLIVSPGLVSTRGSQQGIEKRTIASFHTFSDFAFVGITCRDLKGKTVLVRAGQGREVITSRCDPLNAIQLTFNAPISKEKVAAAFTSQPDLRGGRTDFDPWESTPSGGELDRANRKNQHYYLNLPYGLKANTTYTFSAPAGALKDEFERPLTKDATVAFTTDHRAARFVLDNHHAVLEQTIDSKLPVVVNNIETLSLAYSLHTSQGVQSKLSTLLHPYTAPNVAYPFPIDIRAMLRGRSGIIHGTVTGAPPQKYDNTQRFFAQVTPYAVHAKVGHFNSLVWVTSMTTGEPIRDANVSVFVDTLTKLSATPTNLAAAVTDHNGTAALPGLFSLDPKVQYVSQWDDAKPRLFIHVTKGGEMALVPLSWDYQVYDGEVYPSSQPQHGHIHSWGTTAQGLYRLGDTIQFALWVRDQNNDRFIAAPREGYSLEVQDPTDKVVLRVPSLTLSEFGSFAGEFTTRGDGAVGWYTFVLSSPSTGQSWRPLRVLISDFTPAPFKVSTELEKSEVRPDDTVHVRTEARLHAGGPYAEASVRVSARVVGAELIPRDSRAKGFTFSTSTEEHTATQTDDHLDTKGDLSTTFKLRDVPLPYGSLLVESSVRDDRGKLVSSLSQARFIGRDKFVGITQDDWILQSGKAASVRALVVNDRGDLIQGDSIRFQIEYEDVKVARVKSAGNAYTNRYDKTWVTIDTCEATARTEAAVCSFTPNKPGRYRFSARVSDTHGREHASTVERWASGRGDVVWTTETNNQLQIIPEKTSYKVGDVARFMIQNPFPTSQALLTVERYGVQKSWHQTIADPSAIIEVPVTRDHIPGFFFSATVMSPRVDKPIEGQVDLGKPAFRMGYAQITVDDPAKQISVSAIPDKTIYKPGEAVTVNLSLPSGPDSAPLQYAVTVLDEAVFDLLSAGRAYFDPYRGFYSLDELDVRNYNLMKMLLGRQNFEKKGANPGGDGGSKLEMRSITKYVSYWNPSIRPGPDGKASFSFEAPDNLTGWRVFVMAFSPEDRMGLGETRFTVNKNTEVRSATPNQVRSEDTFTAVFTVMNRTDRPRTLTIEAVGEGDRISVTPQKLSLYAEPFKRYPISIPAKALKEGHAHITLKASDGLDSDALRVTLPVLPKTMTQSVATFGTTEGANVEQPVLIPTTIDPHQGEIGAVISSSLLGSLDGAFSYMRDYPYQCWEQKLSKAVMAAYAIELKRFLPADFSWPEAKELIPQTLASASQHQAPNGGMSFYTADDEHVNPYLSAFTALAFTWLRELRYAIPEDTEANLRKYLLTTLRNNTFESSWSDDMKSTVRAVALAALTRAAEQSRPVTSTDIQRISPTLPTLGLFGRAHYLQAATALGGAARRLQQEGLRSIVSSGIESTATFTFEESHQPRSSWLLDSPMRSQCAALDALISANESSANAGKTVTPARLAKIARTILLNRRRKDRWENTQENLFCVRALSRYAATYETTNPSGTVAVVVGSQRIETIVLKPGSSESIAAHRPLGASDLGTLTHVSLRPSGTGRIYYSTRLTYAPRELNKESVNAGIEVTREFAAYRNHSWVELKAPVRVARGELVAVNLFLRIPSRRYFVVVNDPVPGGLEPVHRELATTSIFEQSQKRFSGPTTSLWFTRPNWVNFGDYEFSFYHRELRHSAARFYSELLEPGNYHLSYVAQAIAPGEFVIPPTHAETMYDPDIFGESGAELLVVE
jgi:uncharacterized protein YfaS (alpha-2-macroglobulin family)